MTKDIDGLKELLLVLVAQATKENNEGNQTFNVRVNGNWEPIDNEVSEAVKAILSGSTLMLNDLYVIFNGEHTKIEITFFDVRHVLSHIKYLESKLDAKEKPEVSINALGKAIILLDDFNNRFGSESWNKTKEINQLDETLKLLKD